jgi:cob(I)alamin adenosyltransferase
MYTGRGDQGETDLLGERVAKDDPRIDLLGTLDESTSAIGLGRAQATVGGLGEVLIQVQRDLYQIMAELAFTDRTRPDSLQLNEDRVTWLEAETDRISSTVTLPREFVLPGETVAGAALDVARTVVRRAERFAVGLNAHQQSINPQILRYLNRLSSLLFIAARAEDLRDNSAVRLAKSGEKPRNT